MINRLLEKLETPRRHLTILVGLLALVFVLTTVVAWRANVAERKRADTARDALDAAAAQLVGTWAGLVGDYTGNTLRHLATRLGDPRLSLDSLRNSLRVKDICPDCETVHGIRSVFIVDPVSGDVSAVGNPLDTGVAAALRERLLHGQSVLFNDRVRGGEHFIQSGKSVTVALVYLTLDQNASPVRITGVVLEPAFANELLDHAFRDAQRYPGVATTEVSSGLLFEGSARIDDAQLFSNGTGEEFITAAVGAPVYGGLTLALVPGSTATALMSSSLDRKPERLTILILMLGISLLLIVAMMQVKREAELTRLRADFVSGVSHELRTPLAQIRMFTETLMLGRTRSDVERRRSLEIIDQEARRLTHLVENVLLFSKAEGGRQPRVTPEPTNFADEIRQAVETMSLLCRGRSIEVRTELQENITVPVDRMALRQILINLVDNALKYGPAGQRITVGAALFDEVARVWVDDEGPGIPAEDRTRVFDSFYRLPREAESRVTGSGIGLSVVRELARLHGGSAWAEAAPGSGARFVVQFPDASLRSESAAGLAAAS